MKRRQDSAEYTRRKTIASIRTYQYIYIYRERGVGVKRYQALDDDGLSELSPPFTHSASLYVGIMTGSNWRPGRIL